jgi:hypothetical protein
VLSKFSDYTSLIFDCIIARACAATAEAIWLILLYLVCAFACSYRKKMAAKNVPLLVNYLAVARVDGGILASYARIDDPTELSAVCLLFALSRHFYY